MVYFAHDKSEVTLQGAMCYFIRLIRQMQEYLLNFFNGRYVT